MQEWLSNAWNGWFRFTDQGKYIVLLIGVLLYLWYREYTARVERRNAAGGNKDRPGRVLLLSASMAVALAALPFSAVLLMMYQTRFYDYEWIWALAPVTLMIAYGGTLVYMDCYERYWKGQWLRPVAWAAFWLAVLALCGSLGGSAQESGEIPQRQKTQELVDYLEETGDTKDICLWAPRELMEYVRTLDGGITLIYGRNMWEDAVKAYSYDVYEPEVVRLYEWMERPEADTAGECFRMAAALGVNVIVLPEGTGLEAELASAVSAAGKQLSTGFGKSLEGYQVYQLR